MKKLIVSQDTVHSSSEKDTFPKHITIIQGEALLYKCTICDKTFKTKSNCCYHKHCADNNNKPYCCSICDKKFSSKTHYTYHSLMHTGVNPFKCDKCDKSFKTKNKLIRHQEVHSEKRKSYKCDLCDRTFLRKTSIKVHQKSHTGEKPYNCSQCPKAFSEKKKLINHISSHTGNKDWICEICGKSYSIKWNLELHKRTHSKVRPYYCQECQQSFSQNRYLKRHMETHKNLVKYSCNLCDKQFNRKDNLQRHIVNMHMEYENPHAKINKINSAALITKIINSESKSPTQSNPPARTESVIKSLTKTQQIIDFHCESIGNQSNRISVIQLASRCQLNDQSTIAEPANSQILHCQTNHTHSAEPEYAELVPLACDSPARDDRDDIYGSIRNWDDSVRDHFVEYSNSKEKSTRCFLPKKLITASYRENSVYSDNLDYKSTNYTVILSTEKNNF